MGWNDWNTFGCNVTDPLIHQIADAMVSSGMAHHSRHHGNGEEHVLQRLPGTERLDTIRFRRHGKPVDPSGGLRRFVTTSAATEPGLLDIPWAWHPARCAISNGPSQISSQ
jgi:hypothetical protein